MEYTENGVAIIDYEPPNLNVEDDEDIETTKNAPTRSTTVHGRKPIYKFTLDDDDQTVILLEHEPDWDKITDSGTSAFDSLTEFEKNEAKLQFERFGRKPKSLEESLRNLEMYTRLLYEIETVKKVPRGQLFSAKMVLTGSAAPTRIDFLNADRCENVPAANSLDIPNTKLFKLEIVNGTGIIKINFNQKQGDRTLVQEIAASATKTYEFDTAWLSSLTIGATADSTVNITGLY